MIWYLAFGILFVGFVLATVDFFLAPEPEQPQSSLPDAPGVFTPAQVECLFRMKAQYGAKLDDLPDTNDDDYTQMTVW